MTVHPWVVAAPLLDSVRVGTLAPLAADGGGGVDAAAAAFVGLSTGDDAPSNATDAAAAAAAQKARDHAGDLKIQKINNDLTQIVAFLGMSCLVYEVNKYARGDIN